MTGSRLMSDKSRYRTHGDCIVITLQQGNTAGRRHG